MQFFADSRWWRTLFLLVSLLLAVFQTVKAQRKKRADLPPVLRTIIIDAGHGLPDPGAVSGNITEAEITLSIAKELNGLLRKKMPELKVILTRSGIKMPCACSNTNQANRKRAEIANQHKGDLFISIHVNAATLIKTSKKRSSGSALRGTSTYIWASNRNDVKRKFAAPRAGRDQTENAVLASLRTKQYFSRSLAAAQFTEQQFKRLGRPSRGVLQRNNEGIWVLQATNMPAILVETGYITHEADRSYLTSKKGVKEMAGALVKAIRQYSSFLKKK